MSKKARSLVFLGPSDGEKVLLCFKWGVLNYALECRLDGVQNHSRSRPYPCTRAFSDGISWPSPLLHGREDFWVIIHFCCWVGILCVCFQVDNVLQLKMYKNLLKCSKTYLWFVLKLLMWVQSYSINFPHLWSPSHSWTIGHQLQVCCQRSHRSEWSDLPPSKVWWVHWSLVS